MQEMDKREKRYLMFKVVFYFFVVFIIGAIALYFTSS